MDLQHVQQFSNSSSYTFCLSWWLVWWVIFLFFLNICSTFSFWSFLVVVPWRGSVFCKLLDSGCRCTGIQCCIFLLSANMFLSLNFRPAGCSVTSALWVVKKGLELAFHPDFSVVNLGWCCFWLSTSLSRNWKQPHSESVQLTSHLLPLRHSITLDMDTHFSWISSMISLEAGLCTCSWSGFTYPCCSLPSHINF